MTPKSMTLISILSGMMIAAAAGLLFHVPGLLLGAIVGVIAGMSIRTQLEKMQPENRRRQRRMMRHEGLS